MTPWPVRNTFDILVIGKRLAVLLLAVAAYYVAAGLVIQSFQLRVIRPGECGEPDQYAHPEPADELSQSGRLCTLVGGPRAVGPAHQRHAATSPPNAPPSCRPTCWPARASPRSW